MITVNSVYKSTIVEYFLNKKKINIKKIIFLFISKMFTECKLF